jgi:hypothetical protein
MRAVLNLVAVCGIVSIAGVSFAGGGSLTKDENVAAMGAHLELLEHIHNANIRKASIAGQKAVVPSLALRATDDKGVAIADGNLPPALANLEADLRNTDILGELRNGGLHIDPETSQAPRLAIFVVEVPAISKPDRHTRKLYLVGGVVGQIVTIGSGFSGKHEMLATGTYSPSPIIATDDATDAQTIRVAVRTIVDQYIHEATGK